MNLRDHAYMDPQNPTETLARIAHAVRDERRRQGLDQRTLALVADVGVRSIHRIENAEATVRLDILLRVLGALALDIDLRSRDR
jgi:transcriptional regulator with XRE-family HTH domain